MEARPMRIRAAEKDGVVEVKVLMSHIMETGQRKDAEGKVVPAHFIQDVTVKNGDKVVLAAQWGPAVSRDPFLSFKFKGGAKGDKVSVTWKDSEGATRTDVTTVT
ncbi:thiosulfate oxidation carrier complex protein SoxZ [Achromobacter deleyi]|uniref:thiosulfate oxidation carrier complex protein SoxZ n=1 Tax=Achromobacter deleyi TaxID=1353891 RepID=UPI001491B980|nr:thiosulfate oxidation carrier complex protein SoxZ [Achromobacter deleyi]QVQ28487.1 thiosulfate oxidation carrier complex protein SoxZ [Achromobacter deleyi]UIP18595.1 thiosulfate oxidation carrier complex protein SoxZ [Achromobacter deleyi]